ncbi:hypothetical protein [uncultured Maricaulis sp.]|uniref:hypothetical protein n=1 Tax=uncultured Maricaulis sp. TaxID=174710 RepID=UPI0030D79DE1|tara:strand:+ start:218226 stop:218429 length:204 start_codon:yes stop_codon:yes gene_type:complete
MPHRVPTCAASVLLKEKGSKCSAGQDEAYFSATARRDIFIAARPDFTRGPQSFSTPDARPGGDMGRC